MNKIRSKEVQKYNIPYYLGLSFLLHHCCDTECCQWSEAWQWPIKTQTNEKNGGG